VTADQEDNMQDDRTTDEQTEPNAAGEVVRWRRFGIGARATILIGLTMGAIAVATVMPWHASETVSHN
jgi:hypothetical protein